VRFIDSFFSTAFIFGTVRIYLFKGSSWMNLTTPIVAKRITEYTIENSAVFQIDAGVISWKQ
jgi:hypothetical protein